MFGASMVSAAGLYGGFVGIVGFRVVVEAQRPSMQHAGINPVEAS